MTGRTPVSPVQRRAALTTAPNPDARHDCVVMLTGEPVPGTRVVLRYVPDRLVLEPAGVAAYLAGLAGLAGGLEALALAVLDDVGNEAVPRWAEVEAERAAPLPHRVLVEDRQPGWDNPALLARLARV